MNIEIANRLVELRKKNNLSQEELASRLGISRQAVSKWERAESSPDTDNLICLAKLYKVSLDDLLNCDDSLEDIVENEKADEEEARRTVYTEDDTKISIDDDSVYVESDGSTITIHDNKIVIKNRDGSTHVKIGGKHLFKRIVTREHSVKKSIWVHFPYPLLIAIAYITLGFLVDGMWAFGWVLFLTVPLYYSIVEAISKKKLSKFGIGSLVTFIYLGLSMGHVIYPNIVPFSFWHPGWLIFLIIPLWHAFIDITKHRKQDAVEDIDDYYEDDDDDIDEDCVEKKDEKE